MTDLRFCPEGGWVVAENPVPSDPSDVWTSDAGDVFGCNRLCCPACGALVRQAPELSHPRGIKKHLLTLAQATHWEDLPFLEPGFGTRLYACRCTSHVAATRQTCDDPDFDPLTDTRLPWRCAGHPPPTLPLSLEGLGVDETTDLGALVARVVDGWTPQAATPLWRGVPPTWLARLYTRLRGLPQAEIVARSVASHLGDAEEEHVGAALFFFRWFPAAPDAEAVLDLADAAGATTAFAYRSWNDGAQETAAEALAAQVIAGLKSPDRRVVLHLRAAAVESGRSASVVRALALGDPAWLARSAPSVAAGDPLKVGPLLTSLADAGYDEHVAVAGVALAADPALREALLALVDGAFWAERPFAPVIRQALG